MVFVEHAGLRVVCFLHAILSLIASSRCYANMPADPNNAALLYYQVFLLCPPAGSDTQAAIERVSNGGKPDLWIKRYVRQCSSAIRYAHRATDLAYCDWGVPHSLGLGYPRPHLEASRSLARLLHVNARVLAADGEYHAAIQQCLAILRLAGHIGNETFASRGTAMYIERQAQSCVCQIFASTSPDVEMITWAQNRLAEIPPVPRSVARALRMDLEFTLQFVRERDHMALIRNHIAEVEKGSDAGNARELSDEEIVARLRAHYTGFLEPALRVMDGNLPYGEAYKALQVIVNDLKGDGVNPVESLGTFLGDSVLGAYEVHVLGHARLNAFRTAVSLYLEKAKTGHLAERLPPGVPRDPYSGQDFIYTITPNGFLLRSSVQPLGGREVFQWRCESR